MIPNVEFIKESNKENVETYGGYPREGKKTYQVQVLDEPVIYEPIPITTTTESENNNYVEFNNSSTFLELIRQRIKYVFEPLFAYSSSQKTKTSIKYKPRLMLKNKTLYKPAYTTKYNTDFDYEPSYAYASIEDYSPKERNVISYKPYVNQESYPTFAYSTFGLPDTYVDNYAPEDSIKIKPIVDFEINAKPKPLIVSQAHLILLDRLFREVL